MDPVIANLGLVHMWASKLARPGVERADLLQDGVLGLMRAVEKFDARQGTAFSTYASIWIRKFMHSGALRANDRLGVGLEAESERRAVAKVVEEAAASAQAPVTDELVADRTGYSPNKVRRLRALPTIERLSHEPQLVDERPQTVIDDMLASISVRRAVQDLEEPTQSVLRLTFGLGCAPRSAQHVAAELHLSTYQVRRLKQAGLETLRARLVEVPVRGSHRRAAHGSPTQRWVADARIPG